MNMPHLPIGKSADDDTVPHSEASEPRPVDAPPSQSRPRDEQGHLFDEPSVPPEIPTSPSPSETSVGLAPVAEPAPHAPKSKPPDLTGAPESQETLSIRIDQLEPLPAALRRPGSKRQRERLKESLRGGQLQPIQVRPLGGDRYQILDGHDVVEILTELGHREVSAVVQYLSDAVAVLRHVLARNFAAKTWRPGDLVVDIPAFVAFTGGGLRQYVLAALVGVDKATFCEYQGYAQRLTPEVLTRAGLDPVCAANTLRTISRDDYRHITEPEDDLGVAIRLSYRVRGEAPAGVSEQQARRHRPKEKPFAEVTPSKRLKEPRITATACPRLMTRKQVEEHVAEYAETLFALCGDESGAGKAAASPAVRGDAESPSEATL